MLKKKKTLFECWRNMPKAFRGNAIFQGIMNSLLVFMGILLSLLVFERIFSHFGFLLLGGLGLLTSLAFGASIFYNYVKVMGGDD